MLATGTGIAPSAAYLRPQMFDPGERAKNPGYSPPARPGLTFFSVCPSPPPALRRRISSP